MDEGTPPRRAASCRVVLYVRSGCHLCEEAREVLAQVISPATQAVLPGQGWEEVDIDTGPESADLVERYGELVPVVTVDGVQQGYWRLDAARIRRALGQA